VGDSLVGLGFEHRGGRDLHAATFALAGRKSHQRGALLGFDAAARRSPANPDLTLPVNVFSFRNQFGDTRFIIAAALLQPTQFGLNQPCRVRR